MHEHEKINVEEEETNSSDSYCLLPLHGAERSPPSASAFEFTYLQASPTPSNPHRHVEAVAPHMQLASPEQVLRSVVAIFM